MNSTLPVTQVRKVASIFTLLALVVVTSSIGTTVAHAANFTGAYLRFDRMMASTATNVVVVFKPATVGTEAKVKITFPAGFTVSGSPTVNTTALPAGTTAVPGTLSAAGSAQTVTISGATDMVVGTLYAVNIATGITNGTAGTGTATIFTTTSGDVTIDSSDVATRTISNDQIVVTATVPATFSFTLSGNSDSFTGNLDPASVVSTSGRTVTIATNASRGWIAWVRSANAALVSASASSSIATAGSVDGTPSTLSTGTNGYVLDVNLTTDSGTGSGTVTLDPEYNGTTTSAGGTLSTSLQPIASADGTTDGDVLTLIERSAISAVQAAASDYSDTLTVIGAGNF